DVHRQRHEERGAEGDAGEADHLAGIDRAVVAEGDVLVEEEADDRTGGGAEERRERDAHPGLDQDGEDDDVHGGRRETADRGTEDATLTFRHGGSLSTRRATGPTFRVPATCRPRGVSGS